ncbi:hypothetical protein ES703_77667 [subsurface metagenome]
MYSLNLPFNIHITYRCGFGRNRNILLSDRIFPLREGKGVFSRRDAIEEVDPVVIGYPRKRELLQDNINAGDWFGGLSHLPLDAAQILSLRK